MLGPGADVFHYNHFHLDLAMHGATNTGPRRYCKPSPAPNLLPPPAAPDGLPPAPDIEEPMDVARAKPAAPTPRFAMAPMSLHGPSGAVPPPVQDYDARAAAADPARRAGRRWDADLDGPRFARRLTALGNISAFSELSALCTQENFRALLRGWMSSPRIN